SLLSPLAVGVAVMGVVLLVKGIETVLVSLRAPAWPSTPLVGVGLLATLYATSQAWMPSSLYALGLVARAYFVYCYGAPGLTRRLVHRQRPAQHIPLDDLHETQIRCRRRPQSPAASRTCPRASPAPPAPEARRRPR